MADIPSSEPQNPGIPEHLWETMSAEDRYDAAASRHGTGQSETGIDNAAAMRRAVSDIEAQIPPEVRAHPDIRVHLDRMHALLDKTRDDLRAVHEVHAARFDKLMWRVTFDFTQKQREADRAEAEKRRDEDKRHAAEQREADRRAQHTHNVLTYWLSVAALIVAALAVVAMVVYGAK